jgi:hypothetical protein
MTKADQILSLYDGKRSTKEIAEIVGCLPEYVRVAARQRKGRPSKSDRTYLSKIAQNADHRAASDRYSLIYRESRDRGRSKYESHRVAMNAKRRVLRETASGASS